MKSNASPSPWTGFVTLRAKCAGAAAGHAPLRRDLASFNCSSRVVATYYGNWFSYDTITPEQINASLYTHVYYAFAHIASTNYSIKFSDSAIDGALMPRFTASLTARNPCLVPMLSVGGASFGVSVWSAMASQQSRRAAFIKSVISFARKYGFGGVDLVSVLRADDTDVVIVPSSFYISPQHSR